MKIKVEFSVLKDSIQQEESDDCHCSIDSTGFYELMQAVLRVAQRLEDHLVHNTGETEKASIDREDIFSACQSVIGDMLERGVKPAAIVVGFNDFKKLEQGVALNKNTRYYHLPNFPLGPKEYPWGTKIATLFGVPVILNPWQEGVFVLPASREIDQIISETI